MYGSIDFVLDKQFAKRLPYIVMVEAEFWGFECRLGETEARADFAFAISSVGRDRHVLANLRQHGSIPAVCWQQSEWKRIDNFAATWSNSKSLLHDNVLCFWFEFDMKTYDARMPIPSVFFGPKNMRSNNLETSQKILEESLAILRGKPVTKKLL